MFINQNKANQTLFLTQTSRFRKFEHSVNFFLNVSCKRMSGIDASLLFKVFQNAMIIRNGIVCLFYITLH